jgi:Putative lipid carrier protein
MDPHKTSQIKQATPQLPSFLALPAKFFPQSIQHYLIEQVLNQFFAEALKENELDFLSDHIIAVTIKDAYICFALKLKQNQLRVTTIPDQVDLTLSTDVYTLLELISQKEDADGLFFSRRLDSQGDTELGLYVKNFLATLDPDESRSLAVAMKLSHLLLSFINFKKGKLTKVIS